MKAVSVKTATTTETNKGELYKWELFINHLWLNITAKFQKKQAVFSPLP